MGDQSRLLEARGLVPIVPDVPPNTPDAPIPPQLPPEKELELKAPPPQKATRKPLATFLAPVPVDRVTPSVKIGRGVGFMDRRDGLMDRQKTAAYKHVYVKPPKIKGGR